MFCSHKRTFTKIQFLYEYGIYLDVSPVNINYVITKGSSSYTQEMLCPIALISTGFQRFSHSDSAAAKSHDFLS